MAASPLFLIGIATAIFVGTNIGGSSTGVAFGPATGSGVLSMRQAASLMAVFVVLGGVTVGVNVVETLGHDFVPPEYFSPGASIGVLLFIGFGILLGNVLRVSVSTSETAVVAVAGMGAALGVLNWRTVGIVVMWWIVSPVLAFWVSAFIGRYLYDDIAARLDFESGDPDRVARLAVVAIGCYMAFSAGASNTANAVAPLVGSGQLDTTTAVVLGGVAIGAGAFLLGSRTMETVGEDITDLSLEAALVVEVIGATVITALSWAGIPASLAVTTTSCVIGLGWGRASRRVPLRALASPDEFTTRESAWLEDQLGLFNPATTKRVVVAWFVSPTVAGLVAFAAFALAKWLGVIA